MSAEAKTITPEVLQRVKILSPVPKQWSTYFRDRLLTNAKFWMAVPRSV